MKLSIPPRIHWHIRGAVSESEQKRLRAEAQRQVNFLKQGMAFQGLNQGKRRAAVGGVNFTCASVFGLESVHIAMAGGALDKSRMSYDKCWCVMQFSEGVVIEIIPAATSIAEDRCRPLPGGLDYPECAIAEVNDFRGLRYSVRACGKGYPAIWHTYVCVPTDFESFIETEKVYILYLESCIPDANTSACGASPLPKPVSYPPIQHLDGQFVIMPYENTQKI